MERRRETVASSAFYPYGWYFCYSRYSTANEYLLPPRVAMHILVLKLNVFGSSTSPISYNVPQSKPLKYEALLGFGALLVHQRNVPIVHVGNNAGEKKKDFG